MAQILLGPVVGMVTHNSARILLEVDVEQTVVMVIRDHNNITHKLSQLSPAEGARVFHFDSLKPETEYKIDIEGAERTDITDIKGYFRTLPIDPQKLRIVALSCDSLEYEKRNDMWQVLYDRGKNDPYDVILHLGDNVYMDGERIRTRCACACACACACRDAVKTENPPYEYVESQILAGVDPSEWSTHSGAILRVFRQRYRDTWGSEYKARVLASCCNIMILDDHEIRDDLGDKEPDFDPTSREYFINSLALQVYHEYQRQLWDPDILTSGYTENLKNEFFSVRFGPLLVSMLDARTPRAMYRQRRQDGDNSYYGNEQTRACWGMNASGPDDNTRMWLVGCALPLLFFTRCCNKTLIDLCPADDDLIAFTERKKSELIYIWDVIRDWKRAKGPAGDVILLAGDVHVGGFTDIYHSPLGGCKELVCRQVTTSPINNQHWKPHAYAFGMTSLMTSKERHDDYTYKQYDWVNCCNFLLLEADFSASRQVQYTMELVLENGESLIKSSTSAVWRQYRTCDYCREFFNSLCCMARQEDEQRD